VISTTDLSHRIDAGVLFRLGRPICITTVLTFALGVPVFSSLRLGLFIGLVHGLLVPVYANRDRVRGFTGIVIMSSLGLSVTAVGYVLAASTNNLFWKTAVVAFVITCFGVIRTSNDLLTDENPAFTQQSRDFSIYELLLVVGIALILRGWSHLIFITVPILLSLLMKSKVSAKEIGKRRQIVFRAFFWIAIFIGSWASHLSVQPMSSRFWVSYDQVFRAAMATGLTRWGWTDSNFGTGHAFTYHWLTEGIAGMLARIAGLEEARVVTSILPAFGILFAAAAVCQLLRRLNLRPQTVLYITVMFLTFENSFELYSIGTLWGASIFLTAVALFLKSAAENRWSNQILLFLLLPFLSLLSQSALGLALVVCFVFTQIAMTGIGAISKRIAVQNLLFLGVPTLILQQTLFKKTTMLAGSGFFNLNNFLNFPALPIPLGRLPESKLIEVQANSFLFIVLLLATQAIAFWFRPASSMSRIWQILVGAQLLASLFLLNFFSLGSYSGKFLVAINVLGLLAGLVTVGRFLETMSIIQIVTLSVATLFALRVARRIVVQISDLETNANNTYAIIGIFTLFIVSIFALSTGRAYLTESRRGFVAKPLFVLFFIGLCLFVWPRQYVPQTIRQSVLSSPRDHSFFLEDKNVRNCLDFIRTNTPSDAVIATSMWRLPGLSDERYVLTSLLSQRRTLVDGPVFTNHVKWSSRAYLEDLKNIHTSFANSLDDKSHAQLVNLGASYFVLDTRFENADRTWTSIANQNVVFNNPRCSVIKL
jgi:hypothetical protein